MARPTRIFDAHQHVCWHGRNEQSLVDNLDEHGIARAAVLSWETSILEGECGYEKTYNPVHARPLTFSPGLPLADALAAVRRYPDRFILGYCPHPADEHHLARLEAAVSMHNVKVCGEWKFRLPLDDPRCLEQFRLAGRLKLPVVIHIDVPHLPTADGGRSYYRDWYGGTIENFRRAAEACPETVFLGHGPGFWREISGGPDTQPRTYPQGPVLPDGRIDQLLADCPNVWGDLSGLSGLNALSRDPAFGKDFLLRHADRVVFARDDYHGKLHEFLQSLDLPSAAAEAIYHENFERLVD